MFLLSKDYVPRRFKCDAKLGQCLAVAELTVIHLLSKVMKRNIDDKTEKYQRWYLLSCFCRKMDLCFAVSPLVGKYRTAHCTLQEL